MLSKNQTVLALIVTACLFVAAAFWHGCGSSSKDSADAKDNETAADVLRSSLAGRWYPADRQTLSDQIDGFLKHAEAKPKKDVIALILPHAGYRFSGPTAAEGLKTISRKYKRIIIIGPSHYMPMEDVLSIAGATHYETPLGRTQLDRVAIDKLLKFDLFQSIPRVHMHEHSVQIELPLLQHIQKDFMLVPIVAGRCSAKTIGKAGQILSSIVDDETLIIASSDFVHYGPNYSYIPFEDNVPEQIRKLDRGAYEHIARKDYKGFLKYRSETGATICGYIPIAILLSMLPDSAQAHLISQTTSGEVTGDYSNSVSYLAIAFSGKWQNSSLKPAKHNCSKLTEHDRQMLTDMARDALAYYLEKKQVPDINDLGCTVSQAMTAPRAAFVTLKKNGRLRGCIGDIYPMRPLYKSVILNSINAAVNDRRFQPVVASELDEIDIGISALTVPEPVPSYKNIRIGTDGVVLRKNSRSAVFLPQVAAEQGWDVPQMLTQLSLKAGLPSDAWKQGANLLVFQAVVFGEGK